jgi:hypothetical protein
MALLLLCTSAALYLPWSGNPLVFDDPNILKSFAIADYAQVPLSLTPRQFPYFTLGFETVVSGADVQVSRCVSLVLHAFNGLLLFQLAWTLLQRVMAPRRALYTAAVAALVFVLHPVAVYCAGYLVQRTTLLATLFLLAAAVQFDKALADGSWPRGLGAGLCYALASMSKEHAVTGMVSVLGLLCLHAPTPHYRRLRVTAAFLAVALPSALWVASVKAGLVAVVYEPDAHELMSSVGFPDAGSRLGNWLLSVAMQCRLFFRYLGLWWWPDPAGMAIDIRPDITSMAGFPAVMLGPLAMVLLAVLVLHSLLSSAARPTARVAAWGVFWALGLFLVELSTVRFQEPMVLYRSYLWAPGFLLCLAAASAVVPSRAALLCVVVALPLLASIAWGRLSTFSRELTLWEDAAAKLPHASTPGAIRIHYNRGLFRLRAGQVDRAQEDFNWVIAQDPSVFYGYWARSGVFLVRNQLEAAEADLLTVIRMKPDFGEAYFQLGVAYKRMGRLDESETAFARAEARGMPHLQLQ